MDNFKIYTIRCLTNMHVGNGDASYSLVDKQVQRDVITGFPTINSSSLKGSLRSFLDPEKKQSYAIKNIFGDKECGIGKYKIFPAMLLSIPVRSNVKPFFRATCPRIINDFLDFIENFQVEKECDKDIKKLKNDLKIIQKVADEDKNYIAILKNFNEKICIEKNPKLYIEGIEANFEKRLQLKDESIIKKMFGDNLVVINDDIFKDIVDKLPIVARNKLDNGESENLWYEEVVPRETRFYFGVILGEEYKDDFSKIEEKLVQIGGNATIGYGYCDIESILEVESSESNE